MQLHTSTMHAPQPFPIQTGHCRLVVSRAISDQEIRSAQRLRYRVFVQENGARLPGSAAGLDIDYFDAFCEHLLVHASSASGDEQSHLVGTCRVLGPAAAQRAGGYYSETEFDLAPLQSLRAHTAELGRCCVDPAWRSTGVIMALWNELGLYMRTQQLYGLIGCASISLSDGGATAGKVWQALQTSHLVEPTLRVRPFIPWLPTTAGTLPHGDIAPAEVTPPLVKAYLRCGARLLGPPALDAAFNTADLPMMLRIEDMSSRYRKHFLGR